MPHTIQDRVIRWAAERFDGVPDYNGMWSHIDFLARERFSEYLPTATPPSQDFLHRFRDWLDAVPDDDQKALFLLVRELTFVGHSEFVALYRAAFNGPVSRWLLSRSSVDSAFAAGAGAELDSALGATWFCPITDSMDIAGFCHTNGIVGADYRPDWRSLERFGDADRITDYVRSQGFHSIVLLEDFVGSGSQMRPALRVCEYLPDDVGVLVVPLMCCPEGLVVGLEAAGQSGGRVRFEPAHVLTEGYSVHSPADAPQEELFSRLLDLAQRCYQKVVDEPDPDHEQRPYGPFGWATAGLLLVTYSNTPNNTLPLVHHSSRTWRPLFPRSYRA